MGGHQVPGMGTGDDSWDEEGYDESQRAEILEATRNGPTDGTILTDLDPDLDEDMEGNSTEDEPLDDLDMTDDEVGETDDDADMDQDDMAEDDLQDDFDEDTVDEEELDDGDDAALRP